MKTKNHIALSLKHRPKNIDDLIGQDIAVRQVKGMLKSGRIVRSYLIYGPHGSGKCITGDSIVATEDGLIPIKDLYSNAKIGYNKYPKKIVGVKGFDISSHFYKEKVSKTIGLRTHYGFEIEGTYDHPLLTITKSGKLVWRTLHDLEEGDYIAIERNKSIWSKNNKPFDFKFSKNEKDYSSINHEVPKKMTKHLAKMLGYIVSEGTFSTKNKNSLSFSNKDTVLLKDYKKCIGKCFKTIHIQEYNNKTPDIIISSRKIHSFLKDIGLNEGIAKDKKIPHSILESPKEYIKYFLQAYCDGDSFFDGVSIQIQTASEVLSKQLQILFCNFGIIVSRIPFKAKTPSGKINTYYKLNIYGKNVDIYFSTIGYLNKDYNKLYSKKKTNVNNDIIPNIIQAHNKIKEKIYLDKSGKCKIKNGNKKIVKLSFYHPKSNANLTYEKLEKNKDIISNYSLVGYEHFSDTLKFLLKRKFYWDKIVYKKYDNTKKYVYDLTVPKNKSFVANSIINHNTSLARMLSQYFNCLGDDSESYCGKCASCKMFKEDGTAEEHPSIIEVNGAKQRKIDDVRNLLQGSKFKSRFNFRIYILDEIHQWTKDSLQLFLKDLEEPPAGTMFILCTTDPQQLPGTILSRTQKIKIESLSDTDCARVVYKVAKKEKIDIDKKACKKIARTAQCHPRDALQLLEGVQNIIEGGDDFDPKMIDEVCASSGMLNPFLIGTDLLLNMYRGNYPNVLSFLQSVDPNKYAFLFKSLLEMHTEVINHFFDETKGTDLALKTNDSWKYKKIIGLVSKKVVWYKRKSMLDLIKTSDLLLDASNKLLNFGLYDPKGMAVACAVKITDIFFMRKKENK